ncbi:MAG: DUF5320 domain-containing protein [Deltaproteobacteria bacterium]|nr:DUF5320 domain-containing protein [Deltaproteobacteria bacterium]
MPGFDGTGPSARGPMTSGGRGYCNPGASYGFGKSWSSRGGGFGHCRGRGYRHMFWETGLPRWGRRRLDMSGPYREYYYSREDEFRMLKEEAEALNNNLNNIERRMKELETKKKPDE